MKKQARMMSAQFSSLHRVEWLDRFAEELANNKSFKSAYDAENIYNQITSIIGRKKHFTVDSVVNAYIEEIGLKKYLQNLADQNISIDKIASGVDENSIFAKFTPELKEKIIYFIKNRIKTYKGFIPVLAIQDEIIKSFGHEGVTPEDVYEKNVQKFIFNEIEKTKENYPQTSSPSSLGKIDSEMSSEDHSANSDYFHGLETDK